MKHHRVVCCGGDCHSVTFVNNYGCGGASQNPHPSDADLSPDQNLLVPAIIATAIQSTYFCVRL